MSSAQRNQIQQALCRYSDKARVAVVTAWAGPGYVELLAFGLLVLGHSLAEAAALPPAHEKLNRIGVMGGETVFRSRVGNPRGWSHLFQQCGAYVPGDGVVVLPPVARERPPVAAKQPNEEGDHAEGGVGDCAQDEFDCRMHAAGLGLVKGLLWLVLGFVIGSGLLYGHHRSERKHAGGVRGQQVRRRTK